MWIQLLSCAIMLGWPGMGKGEEEGEGKGGGKRRAGQGRAESEALFWGRMLKI